MKINENNFGNMYFGNSGEYFIQSEFYVHGYEAQKPSPDIGYDLIVTNCARRIFLQEEQKQFNIQVKSTVCNEKGDCIICIDKSDFEILRNDPNGYLVCVFCKPDFTPVHGRIHVNRDNVIDSIQEYIDNHCISSWDDMDFVSFDELNKLMISFDSFSRRYVWFNNVHLKRLLSLDAIWEDYVVNKKTKEKKEVWKINFKLEGESICILDKEKNIITDSNGLSMPGLAYELKKISYLPDEDINDSIFWGDSYS